MQTKFRIKDLSSNINFWFSFSSINVPLRTIVTKRRRLLVKQVWRTWGCDAMQCTKNHRYRMQLRERRCFPRFAYVYMRGSARACIYMCCVYSPFVCTPKNRATDSLFPVWIFIRAGPKIDYDSSKQSKESLTLSTRFPSLTSLNGNYF